MKAEDRPRDHHSREYARSGQQRPSGHPPADTSHRSSPDAMPRRRHPPCEPDPASSDRHLLSASVSAPCCAAPFKRGPRQSELSPEAADGTRTHDLVLTKDVLYQLSYSSGSSVFPRSRPTPLLDSNTRPTQKLERNRVFPRKTASHGNDFPVASSCGVPQVSNVRQGLPVRLARVKRTGARILRENLPPRWLPGCSRQGPPKQGFTAQATRVIRTRRNPASGPIRAHASSRAGDGNRTHTTSLEGWDSTIELHPRRQAFASQFSTSFGSIPAGEADCPCRNDVIEWGM